MQGYLGRYLPGSPGTETGLKRLGTTCAQVPSFPFLPAEYSLHLHGTAPVRTQHTLLTVYTHSRASCAMLCAASIWPCTLLLLGLVCCRDGCHRHLRPRISHTHPQTLDRIVNLLCNTDAGPR